MLEISQKASDLIIEFEVSSKSYYQKKLQKPVWPGLASGITVGIGYDLGYNTKKQIEDDWSDVLPMTTIRAMQKYSGLKRERAQSVLAQARREIAVPWDAAIKVFNEKKMPKWIDMVANALPNTDKLNGDCLGVLVSLAYNRGVSFGATGERFREMRNIRNHMKNERFDLIPAEIRSMKRLWPGTRGLLIRRDREAKLFEDGLKIPVRRPEPVSIPDPVPVPMPVPRPERKIVFTEALEPDTVVVSSEPKKSWWKNVTGWFRRG
jgi:hypothetical protein